MRVELGKSNICSTYFHSEEGDTGQQVDNALQVFKLVATRGGEDSSVRGQINSQGVVQLV
jgi:hypothetical protein